MFTLTAAQLHAAATSVTNSTENATGYPPLEHAHVSTTPTGAVFLSTDRYALHEYTATPSPEAPESNNPGAALVDRRDLARVARLLAPAAARRDPSHFIHCTDPSHFIHCTDPCEGILEWTGPDMMIRTRWDAKLLERFPPVSHLLDEVFAETSPQALFTTAILARTIKAADAAATANGTRLRQVRLSHSISKDGVTKTAVTAPDFRAVVMGARDDQGAAS